MVIVSRCFPEGTIKHVWSLYYDFCPQVTIKHCAWRRQSWRHWSPSRSWLRTVALWDGARWWRPRPLIGMPHSGHKRCWDCCTRCHVTRTKSSSDNRSVRLLVSKFDIVESMSCWYVWITEWNLLLLLCIFTYSSSSNKIIAIISKEQILKKPSALYKEH